MRSRDRGLAVAERARCTSKITGEVHLTAEAEQVLALQVHLLRLLPDDYIATLPADVQANVHARRETGS